MQAMDRIYHGGADLRESPHPLDELSRSSATKSGRERVQAADGSDGDRADLSEAPL